jgi:hypothetical protein
MARRVGTVRSGIIVIVPDNHLWVGDDLSGTCTFQDGIEDNGDEVKRRAST